MGKKDLNNTNHQNINNTTENDDGKTASKNNNENDASKTEGNNNNNYDNKDANDNNEDSNDNLTTPIAISIFHITLIVLMIGVMIHTSSYK